MEKKATLHLTKITHEDKHITYQFTLTADSCICFKEKFDNANYVIMYLKMEELKKAGYKVEFDIDEIEL